MSSPWRTIIFPGANKHGRLPERLPMLVLDFALLTGYGTRVWPYTAPARFLANEQ
ncbi:MULTISPECIES: hypothetical protein [Nitrosomonas]|uniref:hypothetical protein n=1 Tax=Nitrosomonas TaxID=914 RepID=UPI00136FA8AE|nr:MULTISPECIES: hypothetical protein [Nitrosomonas]